MAISVPFNLSISMALCLDQFQDHLPIHQSSCTDTIAPVIWFLDQTCHFHYGKDVESSVLRWHSLFGPQHQPFPTDSTVWTLTEPVAPPNTVASSLTTEQDNRHLLQVFEQHFPLELLKQQHLAPRQQQNLGGIHEHRSSQRPIWFPIWRITMSLLF